MAKSDTVYLASLPPEVVAAMCRGIAVARKVSELHSEADLEVCESEYDHQRIDALRSALAALDAMEGRPNE